MSDHFLIDVENAEVVSFLQKLTNQFDNMQPAYQEIAGRLEQNVDLRFITKTDPEGKKWAPLKSSTKAKYDLEDTKKSGSKSTVVKKGSLLMRTGAMRQSLNSMVVPNAALIGFNSDIVVHHEFGTKKMAARSLLFADPQNGLLGEQDVGDVLEILSSFIDDLLEN